MYPPVGFIKTSSPLQTRAMDNTPKTMHKPRSLEEIDAYLRAEADAQVSQYLAGSLLRNDGVSNLGKRELDLDDQP